MALKSTLLDAKDRLDALLTYANNATGESDTNIGDAIEKLVEMANDHSIEDALLSNSALAEYTNDTCTQVAEYRFYSSNVGKVKFTAASTIRAAAFMSARATEIHLPNAVTVQLNTFHSCSSLVTVDIGKISSFPNNIFYNCTNLQNVIIRKFIEPSAVATFATTLLGTDKAGGYVYVPQSVLSQYQASTNWQTYAKVLEFRPIEGSIYELTE